MRAANACAHAEQWWGQREGGLKDGDGFAHERSQLRTEQPAFFFRHLLADQSRYHLDPLSPVDFAAVVLVPASEDVVDAVPALGDRLAQPHEAGLDGVRLQALCHLCHLCPEWRRMQSARRTSEVNKQG